MDIESVETQERTEAAMASNYSPKRRSPRRARNRVQIDLLPDVFQRVKATQKRVGLDSPRAVFREAFRLFEWYSMRMEEGWSIQLTDRVGRVRDVEILTGVYANSSRSLCSWPRTDSSVGA